MKVIYSIDKSKAIPVNNIKLFEIFNIDEDKWAESSINEWLNEGNDFWVVRVFYTICTGGQAFVFSAATREECEEFIKNI